MFETNIKVYPLHSPRTGEAVKNQYDIFDFSAGVSVFQSYNTQCATLKAGKLEVSKMAFCSVTTAKYFRVWCERYGVKQEVILQAKKAIKEGAESVTIENAIAFTESIVTDDNGTKINAKEAVAIMDAYTKATGEWWI